MEKNNLVAVYGSLRQGFGNHGVMSRAEGEYMFTGKTKENYNLYNLGYYPAVSKAHSSSEKPVVVEVYAVSNTGLTGPLDMLEGFPNYYNRTLTKVVDESGAEFDCWLYHIDRHFENLVESGDWANV